LNISCDTNRRPLAVEDIVTHDWHGPVVVTCQSSFGRVYSEKSGTKRVPVNRGQNHRSGTIVPELAIR
jgi:hypothetical protein